MTFTALTFYLLQFLQAPYLFLYGGALKTEGPINTQNFQLLIYFLKIFAQTNPFDRLLE